MYEAGKKINIIMEIKKLCPEKNIHLYFESPVKIGETIKEYINKGDGILSNNISIIFKYNEMFAKIKENYSDVRREMCLPSDPPTHRCGDILYADNIKDILSKCDIVIAIMGLGHIPILAHILSEFTPCSINTTTEKYTKIGIDSFKQILPDFAGPEFNLSSVTPFYEDPDAKDTGIVMTELWKGHLKSKSKI